MKKLLNTLYVTTEGAGLRKDGENLVAEVDGAERARVPLHMLGSVVVFGAFFPPYPPPAGSHRPARPVGRFSSHRGPVSGNVLLGASNIASPMRPTTSCAARFGQIANSGGCNGRCATMGQKLPQTGGWRSRRRSSGSA